MSVLCDTCRAEELRRAKAALELLSDYTATDAERAIAEGELRESLTWLRKPGGPRVHQEEH